MRLVVEDETPKRDTEEHRLYCRHQYLAHHLDLPTIPELIAAHRAELIAALQGAGCKVAEAEASIAETAKWYRG